MVNIRTQIRAINAAYTKTVESVPLKTEAERYQYLGLSTMLNKEYSDKGSPYAEYYTANNQVISQKMFGLHGLVTPGKEATLNTNSGLMYYQYDGANSVTELTDRHGDEIEHYRYDAFGNIFTGITSPYNTTGYTGQDYDDVAGLVQMDARWYAPNIGRFTTQDSYMGDAYTSQSINRYSYVMNNPVNLWDPTGHVPEWVGDLQHFEFLEDGLHPNHVYDLMESWSITSGWTLIDEIKTETEITYKYEYSKTNTWKYNHNEINYNITTDPETGNSVYEFAGAIQNFEEYSQTDYYPQEVTKTASEVAGENQQYINNLAGDPPKDTDPPAVSISTLRVGTDPLQVLDFGVHGIQVDLVQTLVDFQKSYGITTSGVVDDETLRQLASIYRQSNQYTEEVMTEVITSDEVISDYGGSINSFSITSNGPTLMEAAEIADHVYYEKSFEEAKKDELLGGWKLIDVYEESSLRIGIYTRINKDGTTEYVLANRGTQNWAWDADLDDNVKQLFGKSEDVWNSLEYAKNFVKTHADANITFVGHSKGGAEAAANAVYTNKNAILFNPATVNLGAYGLNASDYTASMTAYIVKGDLLNMLEGWFSKPIGDVVYLPTQYTVDWFHPITNAVKNHLMDAVKGAIREWEEN